MAGDFQLTTKLWSRACLTKYIQDTSSILLAWPITESCDLTLRNKETAYIADTSMYQSRYSLQGRMNCAHRLDSRRCIHLRLIKLLLRATVRGFASLSWICTRKLLAILPILINVGVYPILSHEDPQILADRQAWILGNWCTTASIRCQDSWDFWGIPCLSNKELQGHFIKVHLFDLRGRWRLLFENRHNSFFFSACPESTCNNEKNSPFRWSAVDLPAATDEHATLPRSYNEISWFFTWKMLDISSETVLTLLLFCTSTSLCLSAQDQSMLFRRNESPNAWSNLPETSSE